MDAVYLPSVVIFSSGPATFLITGVVTSVSEYILGLWVGFWQFVFPRLKSDFTLATNTVPKEASLPPTARLSPLILHPVAKCILLNNFQGLPIVSIIMGKSSHLMFTALSVLIHVTFQPHPQPLLCTCAGLQTNWPIVVSSKLYTHWQCSPSPFPPGEIPAPLHNAAKTLHFTWTSYTSSLLIPHPGQDFSNHSDSMWLCLFHCPHNILPAT